jgi:hypothetical protein
MTIAADNPIQQPADDALGRGLVARSIATEMRNLDASEGSVVAVMGPWGSGKTSLINLIRHELAQAPALPVLDFNPWMFSGAEQLIESFFIELATQVRLKQGGRLGSIAGEIEAYGELLSPLSLLPVVGGWIERVRGAAGGIKRFQDRRKESVAARRERLATKLAELDQHLVVVLDDIDRLQTNEIRDIFKLVRLTASFPNVIYLLAFDRSRVEKALSETGFDGRTYLEKIVQVPFDIPAIPEQALLSQLTGALAEALTGEAEPRLFDENRWQDVLADIIWPLVKNMRDVRRYVAAARGTMRALGADIESVDLLGLEAVRVFMPDAFATVVDAQEALTTTRTYVLGAGRDEPAGHREAIERLLRAAGPYNVVGEAVIRRLFPAGIRYIEINSYGPDWLNGWLRARRVAHPDVLKLYLERLANAGMIAFTEAEHAYRLLNDQAAFDNYLRSIDPARLQDVVAALHAYEGDYPPEAVPAATTVLLNLIPDLPERTRGFLAPDGRAVVARVVLRLLEGAGSPADVERIVDEVVPQLRTRSSRLELVRIVGYREGEGHKLVSEEAAARLEAELREAVDAAPPADLVQEWDLLRLLLRTHPEQPDDEPILAIIDDPTLNGQLLIKARSEAKSQVIGSRAIHREIRLAWESLVRIFGGEAQLRQAVESLEGTVEEGTQLAETVELAKRYLGGWRPEEF